MPSKFDRQIDRLIKQANDFYAKVDWPKGGIQRFEVRVKLYPSGATEHVCYTETEEEANITAGVLQRLLRLELMTRAALV